MKIADCHNDFILKLDGEELNSYIKTCEKSKVKIICASIFTTELEDPLKQIKFYIDKIKNIKTKIKLLIHIEDLWFLNEDNLKEFLCLNPFSCGLTWNYKNCIGGGAMAEESEGLTDFGIKIIKELLANNILIDLAHANKKTFYEAAEIIKTKIYVSHTAFEGVNYHKRNIDHSQINLIIKSKGFIGVCFVPAFLSGEKTCFLADFEKHLTYFYESFGKNNIGIGTDFYGTESFPEKLENYSDLKILKCKKLLFKNFKKFIRGLN